MRCGFGSVLAFSVVLAVGCSGHGGGEGGSDHAREACAANLVKLQSSIALYATDNDDFLPQADWSIGIAPYLASPGASLDCPSAAGFGYAMNGAVVGASVHSVGDVDAFPLLFDTPILASNEVSAFPGADAGRHGGNNTVYLSGRVAPEPERTPAEDRALCLSRVKGAATAALLYASDHDDVMPGPNWMDDEAPYFSLSLSLSTLRCPSVSAGSYGYAFGDAVAGANLTSVDFPSAVPMVFDSPILTKNAISAFSMPSPSRHEGNNVAYVDGHTATVP